MPAPAARMPTVFTAPSAYPAESEAAAIPELARGGSLDDAMVYGGAGAAATAAVVSDARGRTPTRARGAATAASTAAAGARVDHALPHLAPATGEPPAPTAPPASPSLQPYAVAGVREDSPTTTATVDEAAQGAMQQLLVHCPATAPAYQLRGELGRGKYGRVFLVEEVVHHRLVAVKATYDPLQVSALRERQRQAQLHGAACLPPLSIPCNNEAVCLSACRSPFIVRLEGLEKGNNGEDLLMLEYVDGGDLRQEIRRRQASAMPFTEHEAVFLFLQICLAVDHLHQLNMMHHDIKPENILLSGAGVVKLGDFGFAHRYAESVRGCVATTGCGTPYYLSPEALCGERYSSKSEMWALGIILYELLALTGPFNAATRGELIVKANTSDYAALPSSYSQELRCMCYQLLSTDPAQRPSTQDLFRENEYVRDKLDALRRHSECSVNTNADERRCIFHTISAALRRSAPPSPVGGAGVSSGTFDQAWGCCAGEARGRTGAVLPACASRPRFERLPPVSQPVLAHKTRVY